MEVVIHINGQWENADTLDDIVAIIREQFSEELASALKEIGTPSENMQYELDNLQFQVDEYRYENQCLEDQVYGLGEENDRLKAKINDLIEDLRNQLNKLEYERE